MTLQLPPHLAGRIGFRPRDLNELVGVSKSQVRRLILDGTLDALKLGDGIVLVSRESVERWLASAKDAK